MRYLQILPSLGIALLMSACPQSPSSSSEAKPASKTRVSPSAESVTTHSTPRWSYQDIIGQPANSPLAPALSYLAGDSAVSREAALKVIDQVISTPPLDDDSEGEQEKQVMLEAFARALRYAITGDRSEAMRTIEILEAIARSLPERRLIGRDGKAYAQDAPRYLREPTANGFWRWHPLDLAEAVPLLRAYDIVRPEMGDARREALEKNLFVYHKELISRFTGLAPLYHNLAGYHLVALIRYGQVLDRPEYIREVVETWERFMHYSYAPDGFFRELSPDYHRQITWRMAEAIPELLKQQSLALNDPEIDVAARFGPLLERVHNAMLPLALPDMSYANVEDSWPKRTRFSGDPKSAAAPGLLGVTNIAKLADGGMAALMKYDGIRGHDHRDALGIIWYTAGLEAFSDTGYQPLSDSGTTRAWISSTPAHLTVAVDEQMHFSNRNDFAVERRVAGFSAFPPEKPGTRELEAALPSAAGFYNQGKLLVWDAEPGEIQAMEAEQERANKATSLFRRTLVMRPLEGDEGYLLDIFRVRGGSKHDYFLRGGFDQPYTLRYTPSLPSAEGMAYDEIRVKQRGPVQAPLSAEIQFTNHEARVYSRLLAVYGSFGSSLEAVVGEGPAIRTLGLAPYSFIRHRTDQTDEPLASCFVWVHESSRGDSRILDVFSQEAAGGVIVRVRLKDRTDWYFSGNEEDSLLRIDGFAFRGRLASATEQEGRVAGKIHSGYSFLKDEKPVAHRPPPISASIVKTHSRDKGDSSDAVFFKKPPEAVPGDGYRLAFLDLGDSLRLSVPVTAVETEGDLIKVKLSHPPGFRIEEGAAIMEQFPGWRVRDGATLRLE